MTIQMDHDRYSIKYCIHWPLGKISFALTHGGDRCALRARRNTSSQIARIFGVSLGRSGLPQDVVLRSPRTMSFRDILPQRFEKRPRDTDVSQFLRQPPADTDGQTALSVRGLEIGLPVGMERANAVTGSPSISRKARSSASSESRGRASPSPPTPSWGCCRKRSRSGRARSASAGAEIVGMPAETLLSFRGRAVSMIFQDPLSALNPLMTVGAQIDEVMTAHEVGTRASRRSRSLELLTEVGLPDPAQMLHRYPFQLSGGQRQRGDDRHGAGARADSAVADEPTTALDVTTQAQILKLIRDIQRRKGMSIVFRHPRFRRGGGDRRPRRGDGEGLHRRAGHRRAGAEIAAASLYPPADRRRAAPDRHRPRADRRRAERAVLSAKP